MNRKSYNYVIGIDEAGRGPLAGPLVVAGIKVRDRRLKIFRNLRDSKKLTPKKREELFQILSTHPKLEWAVAKISPRLIDRINIARAANRAALRVWRRLASPSASQVLLDGSLHLPSSIPHETIIKGDEKIPLIAAASIIAKVVRDRAMQRLHKKYPRYRFDIHKGYATKLHRRLVKKFGRSAVHRRSFRV